MIPSRITVFTIALLMLLGCSATPEATGYSATAHAIESDRYVIRSASVSLEVKNVDVASDAIVGYVTELGGYVDRNIRSNDESVSISARVPESKLNGFLDALPDYGNVKSKKVSVTDVTEEMVDIDARLTNLRALRERFRKLLDRADKVSDVLEIERELSRIQTEIDAIEGRRTRLMGQISYSEVSIYLEQETIYGPLGYIGIGVYWVIEKLFVIK